MKYTKQEIFDAQQTLKKLVKPHQIVYTVLTHVSSSGMSRRIKVFTVDQDKKIIDLSYWVARALDWPTKDNAVIVRGCGMDMGFHLVNSITHALGYNTVEPSEQSNAYGLNHQWL